MVRLVIAGLCLVAALGLGVAGSAASGAADAEFVFGECECGTTMICPGTTAGCPGTECGKPGENCKLVTVNYPTTHCIPGTSPGHCDNGSAYVCWRQIQCTCTNIAWPDPNLCLTEGSVVSEGPTVKKLCVQ